METAIAKQLIDKIYEKRKAAALDLEKQIRDCHQQGEQWRISQIIDQLIDMFSNTSNALHVRNGGLIGLAGTAIALGVDVAPYMQRFIGPLLHCFVDPENRIRYFSAECLYNIAKVSKGEILVYFNDIFDALSKLAADSELSVKNGAELLDRLLKDIVAESASVHVPLYPETEKIRDEREAVKGVLVPYIDDNNGNMLAFSLSHFIPLLRERIYVVNPFTRSYLVSWINVLDSVPELELITFLPEFLDGLLKYLSDPTEDVRVATETLLADFLREIHDLSVVRRQLQEQTKAKHTAEAIRRAEAAQDGLADFTLDQTERAVFLSENEEEGDNEQETALKADTFSVLEERDNGAWLPGQGVKIDYGAIIEILIQQLDGEHDEIQQSTALRWLCEFLNFAHEVMLPFCPRLVPAILPNLAHHVPMIQTVAVRANKMLFNVIQSLPSPSEEQPRTSEKAAPVRAVQSPAPSAANSRQSTLGKDSSREVSSPETTVESPQMSTSSIPQRSRGTSSADLHMTPRAMPADRPTQAQQVLSQASRPHSPLSFTSQTGHVINVPPQPRDEGDIFDYQAMVNELTIQFLSEFEETRVAALKWLIMLHQKAPKKILSMDDGTFPALLKTLSDDSEEVIKCDLQLLAQISSSSEETYFKSFMMNLLDLFSTDRRLLETRGSLIVRQLCLNLNTERIYRTFAEILEKEDDLEFASVIVQKLNIILITSPQMSDFRKRLKNLEIRQDGQVLFTTLYRSWCHNSVAVFSLCLLAQAYEHASNLLYMFADLEITVPMLVQIDKLVQLIESPVFTYLRLQLLEPDRYPHLYKCLYGLLMLLPQSTAFLSLRNRLNAVNSAGFLHIAPKPAGGPFSTRSKLARDEIKWQELLAHFRSVQARHEKARRQALGAETVDLSDFAKLSEPPPNGDRVGRPPTVGRAPIRRRVTGEMPLNPPALPASSRNGALSPLNPRARGSVVQNGVSTMIQMAQKPRRPISLTRK